MLSRDRLVRANKGIMKIIHRRLEAYMSWVPGILADARTALVAGDARRMYASVHELANCVRMAGGTGPILAAAEQAEQDCGDPSAPWLPTDPQQFLGRLDDLQRLHAESLPDAAKVAAEFAQ